MHRQTEKSCNTAEQKDIERGTGAAALKYSSSASISKRLWSPGIDSKELITPAYVAWRAGMITLFLLGS
jgi:hypothetical protein